MQKICLFFSILLLAGAGNAHADEVFLVTMNTSSISGDSGSLDFSLSPGAGSDQSLTATVYNFAGGSYGGSMSQDGNATGGPVTSGSPLTLLANSASQLNDDFETFDYGNSLSFLVSLSGPALTAPDGIGTSSCEFDFETFSDEPGSDPVLTDDPNGISGLIDISPEGIVSSAGISPDATVASVPEPASLWLFAGSIGFFGAAFVVRRVGELSNR